MTLREQFEKETGINPMCPGIDIYRINYIEWLEARCEECPKYSKAEYRKLESDILRRNAEQSEQFLRIKELESENKRLREALEGIRQLKTSAVNMSFIAAEALTEKEEGNE